MPTVIDHGNIDIEETKEEKILKRTALYMTAVFFTFTGARHFVYPEFYMLMMPNYLPVPLFLLYFTGLFQIVCAIGLIFLRTRKWAAYGLMAFLVATLPIHVYLWTYKEPLPHIYSQSWLKVLSIPLQFLLIAWMYLFAQKPKSY